MSTKSINNDDPLINRQKCHSLQYLYRYHHVKDSIIDDDIKKILFFFQKDRKCSFLLYGDNDTGKTSIVHSFLTDYYSLNNGPMYQELLGRIGIDDRSQ